MWNFTITGRGLNKHTNAQISPAVVLNVVHRDHNIFIYLTSLEWVQNGGCSTFSFFYFPFAMI